MGCSKTQFVAGAYIHNIPLMYLRALHGKSMNPVCRYGKHLRASGLSSVATKSFQPSAASSPPISEDECKLVVKN